MVSVKIRPTSQLFITGYRHEGEVEVVSCKSGMHMHQVSKRLLRGLELKTQPLRAEPGRVCPQNRPSPDLVASTEQKHTM